VALDSISRPKLWNLISWLPNTKAWKGSFSCFFLFNFFFQLHNQEKIFKIFCTNLHPIFFQLNLNSILNFELNLNMNLIESNSIQVVCNAIQYFHLNKTLFHFFFSSPWIHSFSLVVCNNIKPKWTNMYPNHLKLFLCDPSFYRC